jgi:hypothetical protein
MKAWLAFLAFLVLVGSAAAQPVGGTFTQSAAAEATHIFKATPGNLFSIYATNLTATVGFLAVVASATVPADGAIVPLDCVPLPASGSASINYLPGPPKSYTSGGVVAVLTSAATCFTKTTGVITGFIAADVQ